MYDMATIRPEAPEALGLAEEPDAHREEPAIPATPTCRKLRRLRPSQ